jgi:hypothetical protein
MSALVRGFSFFLISVLGCGATIWALANAAEKTSAAPPVTVIGFMGGRVRHDNLVHSGVQLAERLRADYPSGLSRILIRDERTEKETEEQNVPPFQTPKG